MRGAHTVGWFQSHGSGWFNAAPADDRTAQIFIIKALSREKRIL